MMPSRRTIWTVWIVVGWQVLLVALQLALQALLPGGAAPAALFNQLAGALVLISFPAVGALIVLRRPGHRIGWLFCIANIGWDINNFCSAYARYNVLVRGSTLPGLGLAAWLYTWPGLFSMALYEYLVLLFPTGRLPSPRWRLLAWAIAGLAVVGALASALAAGPVDSSFGLTMANPLGLPNPVGAWLGGFAGFATLLLTLLFLGAAASLVVRWRGSGPLERQQLKWLVSAVILWACMVLASSVLMLPVRSLQVPPLWAALVNQLTIAGSSLIPIASGVAILRYHLYDIDLIIRRTLVYALLTAILALAYFGSVLLLEALTRSLFGSGQNEIVTVVSTLFIAAIFMPLRRRIQDQVDRRFYRRKYNAAQTLARFGVTVRDEVNLDALAGQLISVVHETMQPEHVSLWLHARPHK